MQYVMYDLVRDVTVSREFNEDELDRFTTVFNERRHTEQCKYDYAVVESDTGNVVGYLRNIN